MNEQTNKCPVCKLGQDVKKHEPIEYSPILYDCPRCGLYNIEKRAEHTIEREPDDEKRMKISAWIRNNYEVRKEPYIIDWDTFCNIESFLPDYSVLEKQRILLQNIKRKTKYPGQSIAPLLEYDFPLAWAKNEEEFRFHLRSLENRHLIDKDATLRGSCSIKITSEGWEYLDKHEFDIEGRTQVFVAMSFNPELNSVWENAIKPSIEKAGYTALRIDKEPYNERIDAKIMAEIKNSRFIVADFTENKHGVYFEAGYALGIGIPVLWCVKKEDLEKLHFDTRQYGHIDWESEEELKEKLYNYICAIIGKRK